MKIRKGVASYKLPPIGELLTVVLDESTKQHPKPYQCVLRGQPDDHCFKDKRRGTPRFFAIVQDWSGVRIKLAPIPDKASKIVVRYYPPAQEA
jgi:hypothetical protein